MISRGKVHSIVVRKGPHMLRYKLEAVVDRVHFFEGEGGVVARARDPCSVALGCAHLGQRPEGSTIL